MKTPEIDNESYNNLLKMLCSTEEDRVVALSTIDNVDRTKNYCKILLLKKLGQASSAEWKANAPKTCKWIKSNGLDPEEAITYQEIFNILLRRKSSKEELQFLLDVFGGQLLQVIRGVGYDFIENVEINLKYNDTRQERKFGESVERVDA